MNKKNNNKGFTLVELIVVLVILAILAAILVPALLGYIDRAKQQQVVLNARSAYTAAQAELTSRYAKDKDTTKVPTLTADDQLSISDTADISFETGTTVTCTIYVKGGSDRGNYTVSGMDYTEGSTTIHFDGKSWDAAAATGTSIGNVDLTKRKTKKTE